MNFPYQSYQIHDNDRTELPSSLLDDVVNVPLAGGPVLGRPEDVNGRPHLTKVVPDAAAPGAQFNVVYSIRLKRSVAPNTKHNPDTQH